jgi:hypothetical protein
MNWQINMSLRLKGLSKSLIDITIMFFSYDSDYY